MTTEQLSFWDEAKPAKSIASCPGTIEQDGQTLWYVDGLADGTPRYELRPDLDVLVGVPYDLALNGWRLHPIKKTWLTLQVSNMCGITCAHDLLSDSIASARKMDAANAAHPPQPAEQVKKSKRAKKAAA